MVVNNHISVFNYGPPVQSALLRMYFFGRNPIAVEKSCHLQCGTRGRCKNAGEWPKARTSHVSAFI